MNEEEIVNMGVYTRTLMLDRQFNALVHQYETTRMQNLLSTKSTDAAEREKIYADINGVRDFFNFAKGIVDAAEKLTAPPKERDHLDIIDDPAVHNIFD